MSMSRDAICWLSLTVFCGLCPSGCRQPTEDLSPLPASRPLAEHARPILVDSGPLPETGDQPAKPVVVADHEHRVQVIAMDVRELEARLTFWKSSDGGRSWQAPIALENWPTNSRFMADPWLQADRRGRVYLVHTAVAGMPLVLRTSTDAGRSWSNLRKIADHADRPVLGISPNGRQLVIAASMSERTAEYPTEPLDGNDPLLKTKIKAAFRHHIGIYTSEDSGRSWTRRPEPLGSRHAIAFSVVIDDTGRIACSGVVEGQGARSVVCMTTDHGETWRETELAGNLQPDRDHPFNGERFPVLALDGAGGLHTAFVGALGKELFVRRNEAWQQWQTAVKLSSDEVEAVRMPAIAAWGPMVHVIWMQRQSGRWQTYYRGSRDSGRNWSEKLLLSLPNANSELVNHTGFERVSDDDQSSITDDGTGSAHAVWSVISSNTSNTPDRVWHAKIEWRSDEPVSP